MEPVYPRYLHEVTNHSRNFVDSRTGAHTNNVECLWKNAKRRFKEMTGVQDSTLRSHSDDFFGR
ncbi:Uncharacterized protein FKW44_008435 [Caligus rogercresseyi]|uniref:ISXO2-like transposase domain-containing protein n=1 Tax=Caligus rogercresseyi TaxID=217165 RepID=A0A7T8QU92_CALRO|nr:Uncharacterized protein FKW44_008435 [Caligus rogercresseyi]